MKKATDEIHSKMAMVDLVIEVVDARGLRVSSNPELLEIVNHKPVLRVALKADLSDLSKTTIDQHAIIGSIKNKHFKQVIIDKIDELLAARIAKYKSKGLINYNFVIMIVGIPNVGKSSLINFLASRNIMKVENRAGVTKNQNIRKINDHLFLIDTPGVLIKKIETLTDAYQLALLNCIKKEILPMHDVIEYSFNYLNKNYPQALSTYFKMETTLDFDKFINLICDKYGFKSKHNEADLIRAYE